MKASAKEVLKRYQEGTRDFRHLNLRGESFKGAHLSGADFRDCDIRSADFTSAILTKAKFMGVKTGLQRRWAIFLLLVSWTFSALSGFLFAFIASIINSIFHTSSIENQVTAWISLILLAIFCFLTWRKGLGVGLGTVALAVAVAGPSPSRNRNHTLSRTRSLRLHFIQRLHRLACHERRPPRTVDTQFCHCCCYHRRHQFPLC